MSIVAPIARCYTTDPSTRWEPCDILFCYEEEVYQEDWGTLSLKQVDYRGTMSVTANGRDCQSWSIYKFTPETVRNSSGLEGNFCRNPDGEDRVWCYTRNEDVLWDYCDVGEC